MTHEKFNILVEDVLQQCKKVMCAKSKDYSETDDKLANAKLQARIDCITPIEAFRGNDLKHRASIIQGLDDIQKGKIRSKKWWYEKFIDHINYQLLIIALIEEEYLEE